MKHAIIVKWMNTFGGTYTSYFTDMWRERNMYFFLDPTPNSPPRKMPVNLIIHVDLGEERIHFYRGKPCRRP